MIQNEQSDRIPELDGLRGLAILLVMFYHIIQLANDLTNSTFLRSLDKLVAMGWVGVDIFFVLSGFLITSILLRTKQNKGYFTKFYARRILRIFPLYYIIITIIFVVVPLFDLSNASSLRAVWLWHYTFTSNWGNAFNLIPIWFYIGPTWSLAIEEQFYLLWPSVVYLSNRRKLFFLSVSIIALSLVIRLVLLKFVVGWPIVLRFIYFSSFTRLDGLCVGALIAIAFQYEHWKQNLHRFAWPVLGISITGIVACAITGSVSPFVRNFYLDSWGYTFLAFAAGALIVLVTTLPDHNIIRRLFRNRIFTFLGKYSYSMYLIHVPIIYVLWNYMTGIGRKSAQAWITFVGLSFGLIILGAIITWHLVEKPMLNLKIYFEYEKPGV
jgi:peptidoglycan/LPS O-acetylase OafA/YrhL